MERRKSSSQSEPKKESASKEPAKKNPTDRKDFLDTFSFLRPGLADENKAGVKPQECSFSFLDDRIVTFNGEIAVSCAVPGKLEEIRDKAIPGKPLLQLLDRMSDEEEIEVEVKKDEVILSSGRIRAGVPLLELLEETKDHSGEVKKWEDAPEDLSEALRFCMYACGKDMSVPALTCVNVRANDGVIESTDNFRISRYKIEEFSDAPILIPAASIKEVSAHSFSKVNINKGWMHLSTKRGRMSMRTFEAKFPDIDKAGVFKKSKDESKLSLPSELSSVIDRAAIFAARDYFLDERITVKLAKGKMKVRAEGHQGWLEETLRMKYEGEETSFDINPTFLKEILEHAAECSLSAGKLRFSGIDEGWEHVVALVVEK